MLYTSGRAEVLVSRDAASACVGSSSALVRVLSRSCVILFAIVAAFSLQTFPPHHAQPSPPASHIIIRRARCLLFRQTRRNKLIEVLALPRPNRHDVLHLARKDAKLRCETADVLHLYPIPQPVQLLIHKVLQVRIVR